MYIKTLEGDQDFLITLDRINTIVKRLIELNKVIFSWLSRAVKRLLTQNGELDLDTMTFYAECELVNLVFIANSDRFYSG